MVCMYAPVHVSNFLKRCLNVENHLFLQGHSCFFWEGGTHIICCPTLSNKTMPSINFAVALFASPINVAPSFFFLNVWCFKTTQKPHTFYFNIFAVINVNQKNLPKFHSKKHPQCIIKKTNTLKILSLAFPPSFFQKPISAHVSPDPTRTRHKNWGLDTVNFWGLILAEIFLASYFWALPTPLGWVPAGPPGS